MKPHTPGNDRRNDAVWRPLAVVAACAALLGSAAIAQAQEPPLAFFGLSVASDRVFRGDDYYVRVFTKDGNQHAEANTTGVVAPQLNLYGENLELAIQGLFAASNRDDDLDNSKGSFYGLAREDEIDYRLSYTWRNRLGRFSGGLIYYSLLDQGSLGPGAVTKPPQPRTAPTEFMVSWEPQLWSVVHPRVSQYSQTTAGAWYSSIDFHGEKGKVYWLLDAGFVREGPKDLSGALGLSLGDFDVELNASYRPDPKTLTFQDTTAGVVGYDKNGKYVPDPTNPSETKSYPPTIYWLTLRWGRYVR